MGEEGNETSGLIFSFFVRRTRGGLGPSTFAFGESKQARGVGTFGELSLPEAERCPLPSLRAGRFTFPCSFVKRL